MKKKPISYCDGSCYMSFWNGRCQKCFRPSKEELTLQMLDYKENHIFEQNKFLFREIISK